MSRFLRFALVGALATGIQYLILFGLVRAALAGPTLASCIGFAVSACLNYWLNYRFTFRSTASHGPAILKFLLLAGVGLLINAALMRLLVGWGWHYMLAQLCATALVLLWNFFGNSRWTFGGRAAAAWQPAGVAGGLPGSQSLPRSIMARNCRRLTSRRAREGSLRNR